MKPVTVAIRDAILGALRDHDAPLTTQEIWETIGAGAAHYFDVYRNLRALAHRGDVLQTNHHAPGARRAIWILDPTTRAQAEADTPRDALEQMWRRTSHDPRS